MSRTTNAVPSNASWILAIRWVACTLQSAAPQAVIARLMAAGIRYIGLVVVRSAGAMGRGRVRRDSAVRRRRRVGRRIMRSVVGMAMCVLMMWWGSVASPVRLSHRKENVVLVR